MWTLFYIYLDILQIYYWIKFCVCNDYWLYNDSLYCSNGLVWFMVFNATFNNISVISWRSAGLVEEPTENHQPAASHWQTLLHNVVSSTPHLSGIQTHFSGDRHWLHRYKKCSCKSNNQMFKANEWGDTLIVCTLTDLDNFSETAMSKFGFPVVFLVQA